MTLPGFGAAELSGTTVHSRALDLFRPGDMTTTGRTLTISGGLKPVSKSHIKSMPGFGWNGSIGPNVLHLRRLRWESAGVAHRHVSAERRPASAGSAGRPRHPARRRPAAPWPRRAARPSSSAAVRASDCSPTTRCIWPHGHAARPDSPGVATVLIDTAYEPGPRVLEIPGSSPSVRSSPNPEELAACVRDIMKQRPEVGGHSERKLV